ncbi:MAG: MBL fold metallo-hydrolase [Candidatus Kapaibacterium sp.]
MNSIRRGQAEGEEVRSGEAELVQPVKPRRRWLRVIGIFAGFLAIVITIIMASIWTALGTRASGERLERMQSSSQYREDHFVNTLPAIQTGMSLSVAIDFFFKSNPYGTPKDSLPVVSRKGSDFITSPASDLRVTWFGHSSLLVEIEGVRILTDPVWSDRAAPTSFMGPKRFHPVPISLEDLPPLDAVVISHDHYDHLDYETITALANRVPRFIVPLGVGAHLEYWGVAPERITELDWWEQTELNGIDVVCTPARHFSGRFLNDRNATLWGSWAFIGNERRAFFSGDGALFPGFEEIGNRLGPFDIAMMEVGAYNAAWSDVHMGPEQSVQAATMVQAKLMLPIHWGTFNLASHGWTEPAERAIVAAEKVNLPIVFPRPGESVVPENPLPLEKWWPKLPWKRVEESPIISTGMATSATRGSEGYRLALEQE